MNPGEALAFFEELVNTGVPKHSTGATYLENDPPVYAYDLDGATQWITSARTALQAVFPEHHPVVKQWEDTLGEKARSLTDEHTFEAARAIFEAAYKLIRAGRISSLVDGVRRETVADLLDQAHDLAAKNYMVAAAVLAGGALETHLHHLCVKNRIPWAGSGSISVYDAAVAQARKSGAEIYSSTDSKNVLAWAGLRNDAAHTPTKFMASAERVHLMIDGVREFIARVT